jgi:hypothetical protein
MDDKLCIVKIINIAPTAYGSIRKNTQTNEKEKNKGDIGTTVTPFV